MNMTMCFVAVNAEGSPRSSPCSSRDVAGLMALLDNAYEDIRTVPAIAPGRHASDMLLFDQSRE
jgi:hypothetical protein